MTDEDLIARLRNQLEFYNSGGRFTAADRIEELVKERDGLLRVVADNHVALQRAETAEAKLAKAEEERDELGRKLNTARYGQPDFAWAIHEQEMADLRAKLDKAVEALREIEVDCDADYPASHGAIKHAVRTVLAELEGK